MILSGAEIDGKRLAAPSRLMQKLFA